MSKKGEKKRKSVKKIVQEYDYDVAKNILEILPPPDKKGLTYPLKINHMTSSDTDPYIPQTDDYDLLPEDEQEPEPPAPPLITRTGIYLEDYRQFLAARVIQTAARGWFVRSTFNNRHIAATIIQTEWRRFMAQRYIYKKLEDELQRRIIAFYNAQATIIQKVFRGWWVRAHIHNQYRLSLMQEHAAEDLLYCVAFKLHHLLRTHQIPGIYSLRNSNALSKIEKLLATMQYKQYNDRVRWMRGKKEQETCEAKKQFRDSKYCTLVPFAGPNFDGSCDTKCAELYRARDADRKMMKILSLYDEANRLDPRAKKHKSGKRSGSSSPRHKKKRKSKMDSSTFCGDVVNSMKRWKILNEKNRGVDKSALDSPENILKFLSEVQSKFTIFKEPNCYCRKSTVDMGAGDCL